MSFSYAMYFTPHKGGSWGEKGVYISPTTIITIERRSTFTSRATIEKPDPDHPTPATLAKVFQFCLDLLEELGEKLAGRTELIKVTFHQHVGNQTCHPRFLIIWRGQYGEKIELHPKDYEIAWQPTGNDHSEFVKTLAQKIKWKISRSARDMQENAAWLLEQVEPDETVE